MSAARPSCSQPSRPPLAGGFFAATFHVHVLTVSGSRSVNSLARTCEESPWRVPSKAAHDVPWWACGGPVPRAPVARCSTGSEGWRRGKRGELEGARTHAKRACMCRRTHESRTSAKRLGSYCRVAALKAPDGEGAEASGVKNQPWHACDSSTRVGVAKRPEACSIGKGGGLWLAGTGLSVAVFLRHRVRVRICARVPGSDESFAYRQWRAHRGAPLVSGTVARCAERCGVVGRWPARGGARAG